MRIIVPLKMVPLGRIGLHRSEMAMLEEEFWFNCKGLLMDDQSVDPSELWSSSSSCSDSIDGSSDGAAEVGKKRWHSDEELREAKRCQRRKHSSRIHIPRMHIRKRITSMLVNAMNTNPELMTKFLHRHAREDVTFTSYTDRLQPLYSTPMLTIIKGAANAANYATSLPLCTPDACMQLKSTEIRIHSGCSVIISEVVFEGTVLLQPVPRALDLRIAALLEQGNRAVRNDKGLRAVGPQAAELNAILTSSDADCFSWFADLMALPVTVPYRRQGFLILHLDSSDLIQSIDIVDAVDSIEDYYLPLKHAVYSQFKTPSPTQCIPAL